ncbi:sugar porter family MFS transporter [Brachybacterium alimentarium]|uniref:sugar porter family MFS transporter n=1 Tax=Brachybacterium alimentarium TaxID=47845 RepID=UPI003FCFBCB8
MTTSPAGSVAGTRPPGEDPSATSVDPPPKKKSIDAVVAVATLGALAFGFDTGVISGAIPFLQLPTSQGGLDLDSTMVSVVTSALVLGAALGGLCSGRLADAYGRKRTLLVIALLFIVGAIGTSLAPDAGVMVSFRIVLGLAVGGASAVVPVFIGELAPTHLRGRLVARNELFIVIGQLCAYSSNAVLASALPDNHHTWRFMLVLCTLPAIGLFLGTFYLTESPRWLVDRGRAADARTVLRQLRAGADATAIDSELDEITEHSRAIAAEGSSGLREYFRSPWVRRIAFIGIGLAFLSQMTGVNSVMYYAPSILMDTGMGSRAALIATVGNGVVSVLAVAIGSMVLLPRFPRRVLLLTGQIGVTVALTLIGLSFTLMPGTVERSYLVLAFMMVFLFFMQCFVAVIFWLMLAEIFPLRIRGKLMGIAVFANWIANFLVALVFPSLQAALHGYTFFVFAAINLGTIVFYWRFIPETRGKSLEQLEADFRTHC